MQDIEPIDAGGGYFSGRIHLNTLENSRKTYARLLRKYAAGELDRTVFRDLCYGLTGYLAYFRTEIELKELRELEERIRELETS